jgi:hypothetical protein
LWVFCRSADCQNANSAALGDPDWARAGPDTDNADITAKAIKADRKKFRKAMITSLRKNGDSLLIVVPSCYGPLRSRSQTDGAPQRLVDPRSPIGSECLEPGHHVRVDVDEISGSVAADQRRRGELFVADLGQVLVFLGPDLMGVQPRDVGLRNGAAPGRWPPSSKRRGACLHARRRR